MTSEVRSDLEEEKEEREGKREEGKRGEESM